MATNNGDIGSGSSRRLAKTPSFRYSDHTIAIPDVVDGRAKPPTQGAWIHFDDHKGTHHFMTSPRILLKAWNLRPKKHLGQNFLMNQSLAEQIVDCAMLEADDQVFEIGCGLGAITIPAAQKVTRLVAVEKDPQLLDLLRSELAARQLPNVQLVNQDILTLNFMEYFDSETPPAIVIGNLPYNISSQIVVYLIAARVHINRALLMLQKEMAQRLIAPPGNRDYGRLSVMLQYCAHVSVVAEAPANMFYPRPKIDSQVIKVTFKEHIPYPADDEKMLSRVVKAGFSQRRKTLRNALTGNILEADHACVEAWLGQADIDPRRRAETLAVEEFVRLANVISGDRE
jgi:16S rRNA (adenine1518-N6/adenine1519-N6)-dimethyltransferase